MQGPDEIHFAESSRCKAFENFVLVESLWFGVLEERPEGKVGFKETNGVAETVILKRVIGDGLKPDDFLFACFELKPVIPESLIDIFDLGIKRNIELDDIWVIFVIDGDSEVGGLERFFHRRGDFDVKMNLE